MKGFVDIHSHILFGVDDGSGSEDETRRMLELAYSDGIRMIVATPHFLPGRKNPSPDHLAASFARTKQLAAEISPSLKLLMGNELMMIPGALRLLCSGDVRTVADCGAVLIEFNPEIDYYSLMHGINDLQYSGYGVILAHAERYCCLAGNLRRIEELRHCGVHLQINAQTVTNSGFLYRRKLKQLFCAGLISFVATDAHNATLRPPLIRQAYETVQEWCGVKVAEAIFQHNFMELLSNQTTMKGQNNGSD